MTSTRLLLKPRPDLVEFLDAAADWLEQFMGHRPENDAEQIKVLVDGLAAALLEIDGLLQRWEAEDVLANAHCAERRDFSVTLH